MTEKKLAMEESVSRIELSLPRDIQESVREIRYEINNAKSSVSKAAVYTCCINSYDAPLPSQFRDESLDYFFLSDTPDLVPDGWKAINIAFVHRDPRRTAKIPKILPHLFLEDFEASIWVDANFQQTASYSALLDKALADKTFALFLHRKRSTISSEAMECIARGKDRAKVIEDQVSRYRRQFGSIDDLGLYLGGFLLRRHNDPQLKTAMEIWWNEVESASVRDQLSLPVAIRASGISVHIIPGDSNKNEFFTTAGHQRSLIYGSDLRTNIRKVIAEGRRMLAKTVRFFRMLR